MRKGPADAIVRGKTGTLNRVSTLTGYLQTANGGKIAYSLLFNQTRGGAWGYRKAQDEIGNVLAEYAASQ